MPAEWESGESDLLGRLTWRRATFELHTAACCRDVTRPQVNGWRTIATNRRQFILQKIEPKHANSVRRAYN